MCNRVSEFWVPGVYKIIDELGDNAKFIGPESFFGIANNLQTTTKAN